MFDKLRNPRFFKYIAKHASKGHSRAYLLTDFFLGGGLKKEGWKILKGREFF